MWLHVIINLWIIKLKNISLDKYSNNNIANKEHFNGDNELHNSTIEKNIEVQI